MLTTDEKVSNVCSALGHIIATAQRYEIGQALADRIMHTTMPDEPAEKCLYKILRELAVYLGQSKEHNP